MYESTDRAVIEIRDRCNLSSSTELNSHTACMHICLHGVNQSGSRQMSQLCTRCAVSDRHYRLLNFTMTNAYIDKFIEFCLPPLLSPPHPLFLPTPVRFTNTYLNGFASVHRRSSRQPLWRQRTSPQSRKMRRSWSCMLSTSRPSSAMSTLVIISLFA